MTFLVNHTVVKFFFEGLWRDEAFSWAMATRGPGILSLTARDFNPPLYYLLLFGWMQVFGSSETALRSLSVLFFAGTLWVAWRYMIDLLGVPPRRAGGYLLLFALNPMLAYYAVEARMYSLVAFFAAASYYAYLANRRFLYVLAMAAGLYTHYFMFLVLGSQVVATLVTAPGLTELRRRLPLLAMPVLLLTPWIVMTAWLKEDYGSAFWVENPGWKFALHLVTMVFTGHDAAYGFLERPERWLFSLPLLALVLWSLWAGYRWMNKREVLLHTALWALLPPVLIFVSTFVKPLLVPRYLIFSAVGLLLLLVAGLERAAPRIRLAMFAVLCALSLFYQAVQAHRHSKGTLRETIARIATDARPEDRMYVGSELDFFPVQYYFGEGRVFVVGRDYDDIAAFTGKVLIPRSSVVQTLPAGAGRAYQLGEDGGVTVLPGR